MVLMVVTAMVILEVSLFPGLNRMVVLTVAVMVVVVVV